MGSAAAGERTEWRAPQVVAAVVLGVMVVVVFQLQHALTAAGTLQV
jgi:hypothetical protein